MGLGDVYPSYPISFSIFLQKPQNWTMTIEWQVRRVKLIIPAKAFFPPEPLSVFIHLVEVIGHMTVTSWVSTPPKAHIVDGRNQEGSLFVSLIFKVINPRGWKISSINSIIAHEKIKIPKEKLSSKLLSQYTIKLTTFSTNYKRCLSKHTMSIPRIFARSYWYWRRWPGSINPNFFHVHRDRCITS